MSNCKVGLNLNHSIVRLYNKLRVYKFLYLLLEVDNDLTENEEYFREDTLTLGYENEAERIVKEYISSNGYPNDEKELTEAVSKITDSITNQEYYGSCDFSVIKISKDVFSVVFVTGGSE
ncbi:MAG: hypothetical protein HRT42_13770, partial [Campylobacteraceae bacterium]|nr:hypothetical protein [Campylobacteraceae bacterium]